MDNSAGEVVAFCEYDLRRATDTDVILLHHSCKVLRLTNCTLCVASLEKVLCSPGTFQQRVPNVVAQTLSEVEFTLDTGLWNASSHAKIFSSVTVKKLKLEIIGAMNETEGLFDVLNNTRVTHVDLPLFPVLNTYLIGEHITSLSLKDIVTLYHMPDFAENCTFFTRLFVAMFSECLIC